MLIPLSEPLLTFHSPGQGRSHIQHSRNPFLSSSPQTQSRTKDRIGKLLPLTLTRPCQSPALSQAIWSIQAKPFGSAWRSWERWDHHGTLQQLSLAQGTALMDCITPGSNPVKSSAQLYFLQS